MSTARQPEESPCVRRSRYLASSSLASEVDDLPKSFQSAQQRQHALRAARIAFDRQRRGLSYPIQRPRVVVGSSRTQSVRYVGPNAPPLISKDITRRQVKSWDEVEYGSRTTFAGRSRQDTSQSLSNEADSISKLRCGSYFDDPRPSGSRLRKSKSLFGGASGRTITNLPLRQRLSKLNSSNGRQCLFRNSEPSTTSFRVPPTTRIPFTSPLTTPLTRQALSDVDGYHFEMSYTGEGYAQRDGGEADRAWSRTDFEDSRSQSNIRRRRSSPDLHTSQGSEAPAEESKVKKKFKAGWQAMFGRKSTTNEVPIQQVSSQITHYNSDWIPPAAPDPQIFNRHVQRIASAEQLPSVHTYQQQNQTIRVASRSRPDFEGSNPYRQFSQESKDTWERDTTNTEATSSRDTASKRLTVLYEDQESKPSSSAGQVGRIRKLQSFDQPIRSVENYNSQAHVTDLARAIRERSQSRTDTSETHSSGYHTTARNGQLDEPEDYYRPGRSLTNESIPPIYGHRATSNETGTSPWSQNSTIRKVRSSSSTRNQFSALPDQLRPSTPGHDSFLNVPRRVSPATESVYSRDEDRVPVLQIPSSLGHSPYKTYQPSSTLLPPQFPVDRSTDIVYKQSPKAVDAKKDIVDYYAGPTPPSGIRSERSSANLQLSYPRSGFEQDSASFHGQQNERLQHVPDEQSLTQFAFDQRKYSGKKEPSLRELQRELILEDHAERRERAQSSQSWNEDNMLINNDGPYPRIKPRKSRPAGIVVPGLEPSSRRTSPNTISPDQILSARELNYPQSREESSDSDLERTPRPRKAQLAKPGTENRSLKDRLTPKGSGLSSLTKLFRASTGKLPDPFVPTDEQKLWQDLATSTSQVHPNCPPALLKLRAARLASGGSATPRPHR